MSFPIQSTNTRLFFPIPLKLQSLDCCWLRMFIAQYLCNNRSQSYVHMNIIHTCHRNNSKVRAYCLTPSTKLGMASSAELMPAARSCSFMISRSVEVGHAISSASGEVVSWVNILKNHLNEAWAVDLDQPNICCICFQPLLGAQRIQYRHAKSSSSRASFLRNGYKDEKYRRDIMIVRQIDDADRRDIMSVRQIDDADGTS